MTEKQTTTGKQPAERLAKPLSPDTYTWKDFGSYLFHLMLPQAFVVQSSYPMIDAAVGVEKKYKVDPWGRAKNSVKMLWPVVYARPEKAIEKGQALRELHRSIKGVDKQGAKYFALDPEAYSWVHMTGFDSNVRMYELFSKEPMTGAQRAAMFDEWKQMAAMLGVDPRQVPATETAYWQKYNDIIENKLIFGEVVKDLLARDHYQNYPRPPHMKAMPKLLWKAFMWLPGLAAHKLCIATLPENYRRRFDIRYTKMDKLFFRFVVFMAKNFYPMLPESMKYIPLAKRARKDARQHPEAYQYTERDVAKEFHGDITIKKKSDSPQVQSA
ncbi:MAG: DUF2236 domain-containing protein [Pseudomonadales bacterium]|nr:DUF2236 domain-containing protein [Pseudomonadales bacterium]